MKFKKYFKFKHVSNEQVDSLISIEEKLQPYIDKFKPFNIRIMPNFFYCLVHTIISQQLSNKAVDSIWNKLVHLCPKLNPKTISKLSSEQLAFVGFSHQKIHLLKKISYDILDRKLSFQKMKKWDNETIINTLTKYKYFGIWTAKMLLMFSYFRPNIFLFEDLGVKNGIKKLYGLKDLTNNFINQLKTKVEKCGTLFTFCMWKINFIKS